MRLGRNILPLTSNIKMPRIRWTTSKIPMAYRPVRKEPGVLTWQQGLLRSLNERRQRFKIFRSSICVKARELFAHLLSLRGFQGKLIIDHNQQLMKMKVNPDGKGHRKDVRSLSGGEKSFAQVCMLLAVWEAMGSPLRALDELYLACPKLFLGAAYVLVMCTWMLSIGKWRWE
jgi:structural maintenance of chromosomes protein 6